MARTTALLREVGYSCSPSRTELRLRLGSASIGAPHPNPNPRHFLPTSAQLWRLVLPVGKNYQHQTEENNMDTITLKLPPEQVALALELAIGHHQRMRALKERSPDMVAGSRAIALHFEDANKLCTALMTAQQRHHANATEAAETESKPMPLVEAPTAALGTVPELKKPKKGRSGRTKK